MNTFSNTSKSFLSGTGTVSTSGTAVTGVGTSFTTQLAVNVTIIINSQARIITVITDNTHLTLDVALSGNVSGQTFQYPIQMTNITKT